MQKLWPQDAAVLLARSLYSRDAPVGRGVDAVQDVWERNSFAGFVTFASRCVALWVTPWCAVRLARCAMFRRPSCFGDVLAAVGVCWDALFSSIQLQTGTDACACTQQVSPYTRTAWVFGCLRERADSAPLSVAAMVAEHCSPIRPHFLCAFCFGGGIVSSVQNERCAAC